MKDLNGDRSSVAQVNASQQFCAPAHEGFKTRSTGCFLPHDCRRLLVVGAGGFGREVLQWTRDTWPDHDGLLGGFLSDDPHRLDGFATGLRIVSTVRAYEKQPGDYLILGIGVAYSRRIVAELLAAKGANFVTLVHPTAVVARSARVGEGSIICPGAIVSDSVKIGAYVLVNYHASLGHDASAGDFAVLSPYATLGGNAHIENDVFLGLHASVGPGIRVEARTKVSANSCVLSNSPSDALVFGVPGRITRRVDVGSK